MVERSEIASLCAHDPYASPLSYSQPLAALAPARLQDPPTARSAHARTKTVHSLTSSLLRLIRSLWHCDDLSSADKNVLLYPPLQPTVKYAPRIGCDVAAVRCQSEFDVPEALASGQLPGRSWPTVAQSAGRA